MWLSFGLLLLDLFLDWADIFCLSVITLSFLLIFVKHILKIAFRFIKISVFPKLHPFAREVSDQS